DSIYGLLNRECHRLFPDEVFADLFTDVGRRSVPPMIVAVVMVGPAATVTTPAWLEDDGRRTALRGRAGFGLVALWADMGGPDRRTAAERPHFGDWR
ncbi:MAG: hypothetical protein ACR2JO_01350, partial [Mycobacteriales bacterium]